MWNEVYCNRCRWLCQAIQDSQRYFVPKGAQYVFEWICSSHIWIRINEILGIIAPIGSSTNQNIATLRLTGGCKHNTQFNLWKLAVWDRSLSPQWILTIPQRSRPQTYSLDSSNDNNISDHGTHRATSGCSYFWCSVKTSSGNPDTSTSLKKAWAMVR